MSRQILIKISFLEPAIWKRVLNVMIVSSPAQYRSKMKGELHLFQLFPRRGKEDVICLNPAVQRRSKSQKFLVNVSKQ